MRVINKARENLRKFRAAAPGERFTQLYSRIHRRQKGSLIAAVSMGLGILLILAGAALSLIPLVPGVVVSMLGLALIAAQSKRFARWCDLSERLIRSKFG